MTWRLSFESMRATVSGAALTVFERRLFRHLLEVLRGVND